MIRRWQRVALAVLVSAGVVSPMLSQAAAQGSLRPELRLTGVPLLDDARRAQRQFEEFRVEHLLPYTGKGGGGTNCDEHVGRFCYWYDENAPPPPPESPSIKAERARLLALLDSVAARYPQDDWTAGQRVRYLQEDGQTGAELTAALACRGDPWWCSALVGYAYHDARSFLQSDSAYSAALSQMSKRQSCDWSDIGILLDEYTNRIYRRLVCGSPERAKYETRMWQLAKPLYALAGMDTRTEFLSRMTETHMLMEATSAYSFGFDIDERELLLRYGGVRAWAQGPRVPGSGERSVIGMELEPAYQFLPPATLGNSPAMSDSADWENGFPPVHARYAPAYARRIKALEHQSAMFRRGDSSLVVVAYDATATPLGKGKPHQIAVTLMRADSLQPVVTRLSNAPMRGVVMAKGPWAQLLMSAEFTAAGVDTAARARYGIRPPFALGARVTLSDMLFFTPYDGVPLTLDEAAPHMMSSIKVSRDRDLGIYFETYGTNPDGETLTVTVTVAREEAEPGFVRRRLQAMKLSNEASPVLLTFTDQSTRGARMTQRGAYLNIKTLKKGAYVVQLEVSVNGQYIVTSEKSIEVIN